MSAQNSMALGRDAMIKLELFCVCSSCLVTNKNTPQSVPAQLWSLLLDDCQILLTREHETSQMMIPELQ